MNSLARIASALLICATLAACGSAPEAPAAVEKPASDARPRPTSQPAPPATPQAPLDGKLSVTSVSGYKDHANYLHIVGSITNGTESALTNIQLEARATDAAGHDLIKTPDDRMFDPLIKTVAPGSSVPFKYTYDIGDQDAASYAVTIKGSEGASLARPDLRVEHDQLIVKDADNLYLAGELVNLGATPLAVDALAGAVLDSRQQVATADLAEDVAGYLAAAGDPQGLDRTPFLIPLDSSAPKGEQWQIFVEASPTDAQPTYDMSFSAPLVTAPDATGYLHLIGLMKNNGHQALESVLLAALYGEDGVVLDADAQPAGLRVIGPGIEVPYDFAFKTPAGGMPPVARAIVQIDPKQTMPSAAITVAMSSADDTLADKQPIWFANGRAVNSSNQPVKVADVLVTLVDRSGKLRAAAATRVYPDAETIEPGGSAAYETFFQAIPGMSMDDLALKTFVQGYLE